jgi:3-oxoacyl-[acyl-carrier protein] reductase
VQQITAGGVHAVAIKADSGDEAELRDAAAKTMQQFGRLDILVVMVAYLVGPESGFVTGASMTIDGGYVA